jgi:hypothetical protein
MKEKLRRYLLLTSAQRISLKFCERAREKKHAYSIICSHGLEEPKTFVPLGLPKIMLRTSRCQGGTGGSGHAKVETQQELMRKRENVKK